MESSVGITIEKIKLQEQDKEAKLKEKREIEAAKATLNRTIRETALHTEKLQQEKMEFLQKADKLKAELAVARIRRNALAAQVNACEKEFEELRANSDYGISQIWKLRSSLCNTIQNVSDNCDIWALLMKPVRTDPLPRATAAVNSDVEQKLLHEDRLKVAKERRDTAVKERERLQNEPELGEEFVRIKNALRYSLAMTSNVQK